MARQAYATGVRGPQQLRVPSERGPHQFYYDMADAHAFLANLTLVLCVAALTTFVFQRIRQPVVFGYLVAGMIIGPYIGVPIFADRSMVTTLSELGVILLMFGLGLEFSLRKLAEVAPTVGLIALVDTSAMFGFGYLSGQLLGWTTLECVHRRHRGHLVDHHHREGVCRTRRARALHRVGVRYSHHRGSHRDFSHRDVDHGRLRCRCFGRCRWGYGREAGAVPGTLHWAWIARGATRRARRRQTRATRNHTGRQSGALFWWRAVGTRRRLLGRTRRLHRRLAGRRVWRGEAGGAPRGWRARYVRRGVLCVGWHDDRPRLVAENWVAVVVLSVVVVVGKLLAVTVGAFLSGNDVRTSTQAGMSLTQIGEFAFIIAAVGTTTGVVGEFLYPVAVAVSAVTTLTTPIAIRASGAFATFVDRRLPRPLQTFVGLYGTWIASLRTTPDAAGTAPLVRRKIRLLILDTALLAAVVIGTVFARPVLLARFSASTVAPAWASAALYATAMLIAVPLMFGIVRVAGALASLLAYRALPQGSANRLDYAETPRQVLVATLQLGLVAVSGLVVVVVTEPFVPLGRGVAVLAFVVGWLTVVFWRRTADLYGHTRAGAQVLLSAISKGFAATAPNATATATAATPSRDMSTVHRVLPGLGDPIPFVVTEGSYAAGRTLRDLQLRSITGAVLLAITRGDDNVLLPVGAEQLRAGDILALAGTGDAIRQASALLSRGEIDLEEPRGSLDSMHTVPSA